MKHAQRPVVLSARSGPADEQTGRARIAEELGVDQIWIEQQPDQRDSTIVAANYLHHAPSAAVGTSVLPVYTRNPVTTAQAALTLADFSGGRFMLGLGFSHQFVNEYVLGCQQGPPIAVMREYLKIVKGMMHQGSVMFEGKYFTAHANYLGFRHPVPLYLAALRPQMIRLAVTECDGIVLWLCSHRFVREHITPMVERVCAEVGKDPDEFKVITILPTYTGKTHAKSTFEQFCQTVKAYRLIPYYRYVLEAHGTIEPEQLCLIGSEEHIRERMAEFRDAGCTPIPSPLGATYEEFAEDVLAAYGPKPS
ncbi:LLM class flavin-dependent oxidoreductase [Micromonospora sp. NPDC049044]|uniref:LLM class flavin-dependent oxidoreductase n=1 Tax=unclassified Micromonospora TaxID=2617518 RepID=UPI0033C54D2D